MFKHILVPLDGSALAEKGLEKAKELAKESNAKLTLLRVYELEQALAPPASRVDTYHLVVTAEAAKKKADLYLATKKEELIAEFPDVEVASARLIDKIGEMVAHYAAENAVDLIVMTSHGYTGVRRWVLGSVTTETICEADCPILVVPADF